MYSKWLEATGIVITNDTHAASVERGYAVVRASEGRDSGILYFEVDSRSSNWCAFGVVKADFSMTTEWHANDASLGALWCPLLGKWLPGDARMTGLEGGIYGFLLNFNTLEMTVYRDCIKVGVYTLPDAGPWYPAAASFNGNLDAELRTTSALLNGRVSVPIDVGTWAAWDDDPEPVEIYGSLVQVENGEEALLTGDDTQKYGLVFFDGKKFDLLPVGAYRDHLSVTSDGRLEYGALHHSDLQGINDAGAHSVDAITESTTRMFVTPAEKALIATIGNAVNVATVLAAATIKLTPVDADSFPLIDSAENNALKNVSLGSLKATLKSYFDGYYTGDTNLTGDVTSIGAATTIALKAVTNSKLADVPAGTIKGRNDLSAGVVEDLSASEVRAMLTDIDHRFITDGERLAWNSKQDKYTTLSGYGITDAAPLAHVGSGDTAHAVATQTSAGFESAADKTKLDGIATGANLYVHPNHTGDATSAGDGVITLASTGVTAGTYRSVTVDVKGRITGGTNPTTLAGYGITDAAPSSHVGASGSVHAVATTSVAGFLSAADKVKLNGIATGANLYVHPNHSGDATSSGDGAITLATVATAGTYRSVTIDAKGRVTSGTNPTTLAGYGITDASPLVGSTSLTTVAATIKLGDGNSAAIVQSGGTWWQRLAFADTTDLAVRRFTFSESQNSGSSWTELFGVDGNGDLWACGSKVLTAANFGTFTPSITGIGATGSWGISITGNAATSTKLATTRTLSVSGDATGSASFDGSADAAIAVTLATVATAGTYRSVTIDVKGRVTSGTNPTTLSGYGITDAAPSSHVGSSGTAHAVATTSVAGFESAADKTKLDGIATGANLYVHPNHSGDVTSVADGATTIAAGVVTNAKLASVATATLKGRSTSGTGSPEDLTVAQVRTLLSIANVENKSSATIRGELTLSNITAALGFTPENAANKGIAGGYAALDATGKISASVLPSIALTQTYVVATEAAMLALAADVGDIAVRSDLPASFVLAASPASTLANWQQLLTPTDLVLSVNGMTGVVSITTITGNAGSATKLATARTLSVSGDATGSASFDGSANAAIAVTLATVATAGTYRSVTVNAKGLVTAGTNPTTLAGYGITDAAPSSHVGASGTAHAAATTSVAGFLSAADKTKLDGVATGANVYTDAMAKAAAVGDAISDTVTDKAPSQNAVYDALALKAPLASPSFTGAPSCDSISAFTSKLTGYKSWVWHHPASNYAIFAPSSSVDGIDWDWTNQFIFKDDGNMVVKGQNVVVTTDSRLADARPASDVYAWAKAATKPAYTASEIGLGNVTNESKATMFSGAALTGTPTAPTATAGTSTTQIATTAFVNAEIAADAAPIAHVGSSGTAHAAVTTSVAGFMTAADKTKLDGIATGANNYTHPATHSPSIIAQDASNQFVTATEKATWNGRATKSFAIAMAVALG